MNNVRCHLFIICFMITNSTQHITASAPFHDDIITFL
eukprot:UN09621